VVRASWSGTGRDPIGSVEGTEVGILRRSNQVLSLKARRLEDTATMLTVHDRLAMAQGLSVRGSAIRLHFDSMPSPAQTPPPGVDRNEVPKPRPGMRLVELERARRKQIEH
jgi:hypothetical protein